MKQISTIFAILLLSLPFAQDRAVTITGNCLFEGETEHSGTEILFTAVSGSAETNTSTTDENGDFTAGIPEGIYIVSYSHDGFIPVTLPGEQNLFEDTQLEGLILLAGTVQEVSGTLSGNQHWTNYFQYWVTDNLALNIGDTLIIDAGTHILFMGQYEFMIQGVLYAMGSESDSIRFTSGQATKNKGDWKWLEFSGDGADGSYLNYTVVEYGGSEEIVSAGNIQIEYNADIVINHSRVHSSKNHGIYRGSDGLETQLTLNNNHIHDNARDAINIRSASIVISGNHIYDNNGGISIQYTNVVAEIVGNHIYDNYYSGISINTFGEAYISDNQIYDNSTGISCAAQDSSFCEIYRNNIYGSSGSGIYVGGTSFAKIYANDIHNTWADNQGYGIRVSSSGSVELVGNIIHNNKNWGMKIDSDYVGSYIYNNIFWDNSGGWNASSVEVQIETNIGYNCFWGAEDFSGNGFPSAFGEVITVNANGDPSDTWSNIFMDPMLTDVENGDYTPLPGSPLIDAGHPDYMDPDTSVADIGMIYFDWGTQAPVINSITADNMVGTTPLVVQFMADIEGPVTVREWQFGDGGASSAPNPVHMYTDPGSYSVSLTVEGPGGNASLSEEGLITVNEPTAPPVANFTASTTMGLIPLEVQFSNLSENQIDSYSWDFGDGNSSTQENPAHTYEAAGIYTVSLLATGPYGEHTLTLEDYITALQPEAVVAGFEVDSDAGVAPYFVSFTNTTIGTIDSYSWDFGDGNTSSLENPVNSFNEPGTYSVVLTATGPVNEDSFLQEITVYLDNPVILSIDDIPNDNGGSVLIEFSGSGYDTADRTEFYTAEMNIDGNWVTASFSPPYGDETYGFIVHTLSDSGATGDGLTEFRVLANMEEGVFISESVWGYSVDNIQPTTPSDMSANHSGNDITISWQYELEEDFNYHVIHSIGNTDYTLENSYEFTVNGHDEHQINSVDYNGNYSENTESIMSTSLHVGANLKSFNILPVDNSITNVMASIEGVATGVIGEGVAANYMEGSGWMGSLSAIDPNSGYWIMVSEDDVLLLMGEPTSRELPYTLHEGANLMSYPFRYVMDVEEALPEGIGCDISGIIGEGIAATCMNGNWMGSLDGLEGSYGYWFISEEATEITFNGCDEQECASLSRQSQNLSTVPEGFDYRQSTTQAFYFIEEIENIEVGDWILSFNGDEVIGARQWQGSIIDVPAMGSDGSDYTKGYMEAGSVPSFKILRGDELINLEGDIPSWDNNQLYLVSSLTEVALPETYSLDRAYPNPFNPTTTLSFAIPVDSEVSLSVYNLQGREVSTLISGNMEAGYHSVVWDGNSYASGVYFVKMMAGEFVNTQKLMLIK